MKCSTPSLLAVFVVVAGFAFAQAPPPADPSSQDFKSASSGFQISPFGYEGSRHVEGSHSARSGSHAPAHVSDYRSWTPSVEAPGPPPPVAAEHRILERLLSTGLRGILLIVLVSIGAQLLPRRLATEIAESNNTALAIIIGALIVALGVVFASQ